MTEPKIDLRLNLDPESSTDYGELAELTRQLREELLELNVEDVNLVEHSEIPEKTKAGAAFAWGELLLTLTTSGGVLTAVIGALQSWLTRQERSSIIIEKNGDKIEVTNISSEDQKRLIDEWINRHSG